MQHSPVELRAQQIVLAFLGFYKGPIDGIWSHDSIAAKQKFEFDPSFIPAAPSNGLPFTFRQKLPKGCYWDENGLLSHRNLTVEKAKEILTQQQVKSSPVKPVELLEAGDDDAG